MEKRFLLAIALSFLVLTLWSALTYKPKQDTETFDTTQLSEVKEVATQENIAPPYIADKPVVVANNFQAQPNPNVNEELTSLNSERLNIGFSNIGGNVSSVEIQDYQVKLPVKSISGISAYQNLPFVLSEKSQNEISYVYENDEIKISKIYRVEHDDYIVHSEIVLFNKTGQPISVNSDITGVALDMSSLDIKGKQSRLKSRDNSLYEYLGKIGKDINRKGGAYKFADKENKSFEGEVDWVAFRTRYFCLIYKPKYESSGYNVNVLSKNSLEVNLGVKDTVLQPGVAQSFYSMVFIGPEETGLLKQYELGFEEVKKFYRFGIFDVVGKFIYFVLHIIHRVIPNWGVAIILVSVGLYMAMYPMTLRGMSSMKRMQAVQPKMAALKEKYKNNPQKMNQEVMALYKTEKINPLGGCFPFLLQMPVFIGLYQVLWRDVSFKGSGFLWIKDLSMPDRLFIMPFSIPFLGNEFNLLPLIMGVVMFIQQKVTSKNMVLTDPMQIQQQKMMATIFPVFLAVIFYKFSSGLALYFVVYYMLSAFTQWKISKKPQVV